jgi:hypothetical protein
VAIDADGVHYVIETKGQENIDVKHKDRAATIWCENATLLSGTAGSYIKVPQKEFGELQRLSIWQMHGSCLPTHKSPCPNERLRSPQQPERRAPLDIGRVRTA